MASIFHGRVKEEIHKNKTNKYWELPAIRKIYHTYT
jgi:hypothetical protein